MRGGRGLAGNNLFISRTLILCIILLGWVKKKRKKIPTFLICAVSFSKWCTIPGEVMEWHGAKGVMHNGCLVLFLRLSNSGLYYIRTFFYVIAATVLPEWVTEWWSEEIQHELRCLSKSHVTFQNFQEWGRNSDSPCHTFCSLIWHITELQCLWGFFEQTNRACQMERFLKPLYLSHVSIW